MTIRLVTAAKLAKEIGVARHTVYRMAASGAIPVFRVGLKRFGLRFDVEKTLEALQSPKMTLVETYDDEKSRLP